MLSVNLNLSYTANSVEEVIEILEALKEFDENAELAEVARNVVYPTMISVIANLNKFTPEPGESLPVST